MSLAKAELLFTTRARSKIFNYKLFLRVLRAIRGELICLIMVRFRGDKKAAA